MLGTTAGAQLWRSGQDRDVVFWDRLWSRYVIRKMALKLGRIRLLALSAFHRRLVISLGTRRCAENNTGLSFSLHAGITVGPYFRYK